MPDLSVPTLDGHSFPAYLASPEKEHAPGLLLIHEVFGLNDEMRALADAYAQKGFLVLCPHLFWRRGDLEETSFPNETDWEKTSALYQKFNIESGVRDLLAALAFMRQKMEQSGKIGVLGSCLGARLAFLMAARSDIDCAVAYYGVGLDAHLDETHDIQVPFLWHCGEEDKLTPAPIQKKIKRSFERNEKISISTYPYADHGFARKGGAKYLTQAAQMADDLTLRFLEKYLCV